MIKIIYLTSLFFIIILPSLYHPNQITKPNNNNNYIIDNFIQKIKNGFTKKKYLITSLKESYKTLTQPIILKNGFLIINKNGYVIRIYDKKILWKSYSINKNNFYPTSSISKKDNLILITLGTKKIICLNFYDGKILWVSILQDPIKGNILFNKNKIFVQSINNNIYSLGKNNGKILWFANISTKHLNKIKLLKPIIYQNVILFKSNIGIYIINNYTGRTVWRYSFLIKELSQKFFIYYEISLQNNNLIFYDFQGLIYNFDLLNKHLIWIKDYLIIGPLIIDKNYIITFNNSGLLLALNIKNGNIIWKNKLLITKKEKRIHFTLINHLFIILTDKVSFNIDIKSGENFITNNKKNFTKSIVSELSNRVV